MAHTSHVVKRDPSGLQNTFPAAGFLHADLRSKCIKPRLKVHEAWASGYTVDVFILDGKALVTVLEREK